MTTKLFVALGCIALTSAFDGTSTAQNVPLVGLGKCVICCR